MRIIATEGNRVADFPLRPALPLSMNCCFQRLKVSEVTPCLRAITAIGSTPLMAAITAVRRASMGTSLLRPIAVGLMSDGAARETNPVEGIREVRSTCGGTNRNAMVSVDIRCGPPTMDEEILMSQPDIWDAARAGEVETVRAYLEAGADPAAYNDYGFTALHCAAMGSNECEVSANLAVLKLLLEANSPIEAIGGGGRTALYLAAEFAHTVDAVQLLLDAGANADISDEHGNHIVENAMVEEVQQLLSQVTGRSIPEPPPPEPDSVKMKAADWRAAKKRLDPVFGRLSREGLVVLQDAGTTQSDGFDDCVERYHELGGEAAGLHGFCFYTGQDLRRAKRTSALTLTFWGAPEGDEPDMQRVGKLIVTAFEEAGFVVRWDGSGGTRPTVYLHLKP